MEIDENRGVLPWNRGDFAAQDLHVLSLRPESCTLHVREAVAGLQRLGRKSQKRYSVYIYTIYTVYIYNILDFCVLYIYNCVKPCEKPIAVTIYRSKGS